MTDELQGGLHAKGKKQLLEWVNSLLEADFTQVEQLAGGAAYCQMMDALYPGSIALSKVKFEPSATWEYVHNFKLLQKAFEKQKIEKHIDITTLVRAKYQDNLEFLQWMKTFFDDRGKRDTKYEAKKRREEAMRPVVAKNANLKRRASSIVNARNAALRDPRRSSVAVSRLSSKPTDKKRKDHMEEDKEDGVEDTENNKENELPTTNMNEEYTEDLGEEKEEIEPEKAVFVVPKKQPTQQPKKRLAKRKNKLQQGVSKASIHSSSSSNQQKEETSKDEEIEERPTKEEEEEEEEAAAPQQPKQTMEAVERENMMTPEQTTTTSAIPRPRRPRHSLYLRSAAEAAIQLNNPLPALSTPTKIPLPKTSKRASLPSSVALSFSSSSSSSPTASPRRALSPAAAMASAETRIPLPSSFTFSASSLSPSASPMKKAANNSNTNKNNETKTEVIKQQLEELRLEDEDDLLSSDELSEAVPSEVEKEDSANEAEEDEAVPSSDVGEEEQEAEEKQEEEEEEDEKAKVKEKYTVAPSKKRQQIPSATKSTTGPQASSSQRRGAPISTLKRGRGSTTALPKAQNVKRVRASIATPQQRKSLLVTNKQKDAATSNNTSGKQTIRRTADFGIRARKVGSDLVLLLEDMEKENQMLYNKLQQVEQLCNNPSSFYPSAESLESTSGTGQGSLLIASLRDILYS
ncbi:microtubule integrity protein mal3 [Balamuthia mandrillaris]